MHARAVVVVLILIAGCVAAWLWFSAAATSVAPGAPGGTPAAAAAPAGPVDAARGGLAAATADAKSERVPLPETGPAAPSSATYRVSGRIVDAQGAPRPAIAVEAKLWSAAAGGAPDGPARREDVVRLATGADGRFAFVVPMAMDGRLDLADDAWVLAAAAPELRSANGDQDLGDLVALRCGELRGIVQDEAARPVADVKVEVTLGPLLFGSTSSTKTAADGTFTLRKLRSGTWHLRTASSRFLPTTLDVVLVAEERHADLVLVVGPGDAVAGQVVDERGVGVAGAKVGSKRREVSGTMDVERFSADEATSTDAGGFFTLAGLKQGTVSIRAFGPGHTSSTLNDVAVGTGDVVLRLQRLATIEGVLVGADGAALSGSKVTAATERAPGMAWDLDGAFQPRGDATTGPDGSFRLESVAPGQVTLTAKGDGHRPATQSGLHVEPGQLLRGVRLTADAGSIARVLVVDVDGRPVAAAQVRANGRIDAGMDAVSIELGRGGAFRHAFPGEGEQLGTGTTGADGRTTIAGLPAGPASFAATHDAFAPAPLVAAQLPATGAVDVRLVLQVPGFADVHVVSVEGAAVAGAQVQVAPTGRDQGPPRTATTGADGRVRVGPLAPGEHTAVLRIVRGTSPGDGPTFFFGGEDSEIESSRQNFVVTAGATTTVELQRPVLTNLHGTVLGVDGPVAACTVELERRGGGAFSLLGFGSHSVRTAADGSYAFADVEAGDYVLQFGAARQLVKARQAVEVPANVRDLRQDLVLRTGRVVLQVCRAGSGAPIVGADVELLAESADGSPATGPRGMIAIATSDGDNGAMTMTLGTPRAHTDAEGRVTIEDVPVGSYTVHVEHEGHDEAERKRQIVVERQTTDCGRIELRASGAEQR